MVKSFEIKACLIEFLYLLPKDAMTDYIDSSPWFISTKSTTHVTTKHRLPSSLVFIIYLHGSKDGNGNQGKVGSWVMESPDEPRKFIKEKGRGNFPQVESPGKLGKGFGISFQSVIRVRKTIQNLPRQRRQNVIASIVGWKNLKPIHWMATMVGEFNHCHLR
jgi:hypothetical protein